MSIYGLSDDCAGRSKSDAVSDYVDFDPFLTEKALCAWPCIDYYYDGDEDDYGTDDSLCLYEGPEAPYAALVDGDCDDADAAVNPGAVENCENGIDDDCDTYVDYDDADCDCPDSDGDNYDDEACGGDDCDDGNANVHPGMQGQDCAETPDGIDNDCDGQTDEDACGGSSIAYGPPSHSRVLGFLGLLLIPMIFVLSWNEFVKRR